MLDLFYLPQVYNSKVQIFNRPSTSTDNQWITWAKPRGVTMAQMIVIGGGGGGGGGATSNSSGGGGGGGGSGVTSVTVPTLFLPDTLYIQVGAGGAGGAATTVGNNGVLSLVSVAPDDNLSNLIAISGTIVAASGGAGTTAGGPAGAASTIAVIGSMPLCGMGQFSLIAGQAGTLGGKNDGTAAGALAIPVTSTISMGGGGGGGCDGSAANAGGTMTAIAGAYLSEQRPSSAAAISGHDGSGGLQFWKPFWNFGGLGGAGHFTQTAGKGGNGAYGSGGGGGGCGVTSGGRGGDGGNGIVIMTCW